MAFFAPDPYFSNAAGLRDRLDFLGQYITNFLSRLPEDVSNFTM